MEQSRTCAYRNCDIVISGGKTSKIYCSREHKQNERKYRKRAQLSLEKKIEFNTKLVEEAKAIKKIINDELDKEQKRKMDDNSNK